MKITGHFERAEQFVDGVEAELPSASWISAK